MKLLPFFLLLASTTGAFADGRADWKGYNWRIQDFGKCISVSETNGCQTHHAKWDWKRNQWVDVFYGKLDSGGLLVTQILTNNDPKDDDYVCVTVLFLDEAGRNIAVHHANVHIDPRTRKTSQQKIVLNPSDINAVRRVEVGSKQCRDGAHQDDDVFQTVSGAKAR